MRNFSIGLLLIALVSLPASAQSNPQTRQGFWINFGVGAGSLSCDDCGDERETGTNLNLRMGGTLSQRLILGGELNFWTKTEGDISLSTGHIGPIILFYPSANGGFFLKGGLGLASSTLELGSLTFEDQGIGLTLGLGYDARVGRNFALTPYLDILNSGYDGGSLNTVAFGLGFTWP
jgi:hypothetical protein